MPLVFQAVALYSVGTDTRAAYAIWGKELCKLSLFLSRGVWCLEISMVASCDKQGIMELPTASRKGLEAWMVVKLAWRPELSCCLAHPSITRYSSLIIILPDALHTPQSFFHPTCTFALPHASVPCLWFLVFQVQTCYGVLRYLVIEHGVALFVWCDWTMGGHDMAPGPVLIPFCL